MPRPKSRGCGNAIASSRTSWISLAVANADLRAMAAPAAPAPAPAGPPIESFAALRVHGASRALRSEPDRTIEQASGAANATCVALHQSARLACGGADGVLRLHIDGAEPIQHACGSPPLRLAFSPFGGDCLACGCMDGSVRFLSTENLSVSIRDNCRDARVRRDRAVTTRRESYRLLGAREFGNTMMATSPLARGTRPSSSITVRSEKPAHAVLPSNPESLCFCPGGKELIVYCRGEPFRSHIKIEDLCRARRNARETRVSLNANDWDTHCSFAVLDMAVSPDGKYLACATDANKHIIYPLHGNEHVKVLVGHTADEYANARIAWLGESVVSNSQKDPGLYQWDIGSGKILKRVERAHGKAVRDLAVADDGTLATCSFDKAAKLWPMLLSSVISACVCSFS